MQVVNREIPIRDRAKVQGHIDSLNAILPGDPINQMDVLASDGGSGYTLDADATQLVLDRVAKLRSHGTSDTEPVTGPALLAIQFFKINLPLVTIKPTPVVEDMVLTPEDRIDLVKLKPVSLPSKPKKAKH